ESQEERDEDEPTPAPEEEEGEGEAAAPETPEAASGEVEDVGAGPDAGGLTAEDYDPALDAIPSESPQVANDEIDWESYLEDGFDPSEGRNEEHEAPEELFERTPVYDISLQDHLLEQLKDRELAPDIRDLVEYLVYSLDDRGWLVADPVPPAADAGASPSPVVAEEADPRRRQIVAVIEGRLDIAEADGSVREALHVLQSFDPPGVGARDLQECLLIQMRRTDRISPLARRIVEDEFPLLERLK